MKYFLTTLGCAKNVADSDGIGSLLDRAGYAASERAEDADVLIVNTCGFLQASRQESLAALRELGDQKHGGQLLIAAGCLISRYGEAVQREVPQVDSVIDAGRWLAMPRLIEHLRSEDHKRLLLTEPYSAVVSSDEWRVTSDAIGERRMATASPDTGHSPRSVVEQLPRTPRGPSAYLKIADGCDRPCTFCIIPAIKGAHRSKPMDAVIAEARDLVAHGVKEIVLVAQDTTAYGRDFSPTDSSAIPSATYTGEKSRYWDWGKRDLLAMLIERLCTEVDGLRWLRLMYAYPGHVTPRLIETMARYPQVVHYIDVPLQHAHPETLKRMKRPNIVVTRQMLDALRAAMPDLAIRTTFIVGFPDETNEEFNALLEFLEEQQFDRVGVFEYSPEEGTPAALMPDQVAPKTKKHRRERAMSLQQKISLAKNKRWVGKELDVLIEGAGDGVSIARSYRDAPEVDGVVIVQRELPPCEFVRVKITKAIEYDLMAEPI